MSATLSMKRYIYIYPVILLDHVLLHTRSVAKMASFVIREIVGLNLINIKTAYKMAAPITPK